eukprot:g31736.t1
MDRLEVPQELCDMLRSCLGVLPSVLALNQRVKSQAVQYKLLHSLGSFVSCLEPPSRIQRYFGLLVILSEISWLDPSYVLTALHRLVFSPSSLSWEAGMRVLITCRRMILSHPQAVIYQPMLRLLQHLATYQSDVDLRDRALLYLRLLSHSGPAALGALFNPHPGNMQRMTQMLSPVLPLTVRLVNGPVPFLRLVKSPQERKRLGLLDRQTAVFVLPGEELTSDWEKRWGDAGVDHQFPKEWHQEWPDFAETDSEGLDVLLREYRKLLQASPSSIRLPFVLHYEAAADMENGLLESPRQLFSLELTFSSSEHYLPIEPIRIPFIAASQMDGRRRSPVLSCPFLPCLQRLSHISDHHRSYLPAIRAHPVFDPTNTLNLSLLCWVSMSLCSALQEEEEESGFPCLNKLLLRLRPLSPVPTSFGVNIAFNDSFSQMYLGQLEAFEVAFQEQTGLAKCCEVV